VKTINDDLQMLNTARLELECALSRLERAIMARDNFLSEHGDLTAVSAELLASLLLEGEVIAVEVDEATRQVKHCIEVARNYF
jgi:hypothetical protein